MYEVLVMGIGVIEFEGRTLVEGHQHIIGGTDQAEGAARTEVTTVNSAGMTSKFTEIGASIPHNCAD